MAMWNVAIYQYEQLSKEWSLAKGAVEDPLVDGEMTSNNMDGKRLLPNKCYDYEQKQMARFHERYLNIN